MKKISFTDRIWAARRAQSKALASAVHKREMPAIELSDADWELLRQADALHRQMLAKEGKK
jgi:hypothetical protein